MKRRNREINIFNLSMMDVIFGALGAFMLLFLIVSLEMHPPAPAPKTCPTCQSCPSPPQCQICKKDSFFVVWIGWSSVSTRTDVDLYVVAPDGSFCGFVRKRNSTPEMDLIFDYQSPGRGSKEMIVVPQAGPGTWKVMYHHYKGAPAVVRGSLRGSNNTKYNLRPVRITQQSHGIKRGRMAAPGRTVLTFELDRNGNFVNFREGGGL